MKTVDNILRRMRRLADEAERGDCYDLRGLGTDSLRALADRIEAAEKREIETLRALVEGLIKASSVDCASCGYDCGPRRENCITKKAIVYLEGHS